MTVSGSVVSVAVVSVHPSPGSRSRNSTAPWSSAVLVAAIVPSGATAFTSVPGSNPLAAIWDVPGWTVNVAGANPVVSTVEVSEVVAVEPSLSSLQATRSRPTRAIAEVRRRIMVRVSHADRPECAP